MVMASDGDVNGCFPDNTRSRFRIPLKTPLNCTSGRWQVAVTDLTMPKSLFNISLNAERRVAVGSYQSPSRPQEGFYGEIKIPPGRYTPVGFCNMFNKIMGEIPLWRTRPGPWLDKSNKKKKSPQRPPILKHTRIGSGQVSPTLPPPPKRRAIFTDHDDEPSEKKKRLFSDSEVSSPSEKKDNLFSESDTLSETQEKAHLFSDSEDERPPRKKRKRRKPHLPRTEAASKKKEQSFSTTEEEEEEEPQPPQPPSVGKKDSPSHSLELGQDDTVSENEKKAGLFHDVDSPVGDPGPEKKMNPFHDSGSDSAAELHDHDKTAAVSSSPEPGEKSRKTGGGGGGGGGGHPRTPRKPRKGVDIAWFDHEGKAVLGPPPPPNKLIMKRRQTYPPPSMVGSPTRASSSSPPLARALFVDPTPVKPTVKRPNVGAPRTGRKQTVKKRKKPSRRRSFPRAKTPRWKRFYHRTHSGSLIEKWHDSWGDKSRRTQSSPPPPPPPPPPSKHSDTPTLRDDQMEDENQQEEENDHHDEEGVVLVDAFKQMTEPVVSRGRFYMINQDVEFWKNKPLAKPDEIKMNQGSSLMAKVLMNNQAKIVRRHVQQLYKKTKAKAQKEPQVMDAQTLKMVPDRIKAVVKPNQRGPYTHGGVGIVSAYHKPTKKIAFSFYGEAGIWFHIFNPQLRFMLGWGETQAAELQRIKEFGKTRFLEHVCQLNHFIEDVYLYADFVQWSALGSIEAPFLSYHNLGKLWSSETNEEGSNSFEIGVPAPKYIQVEPKILTQLGFKLTDSAGTDLGFMAGRVVITLHFMRVK